MWSLAGSQALDQPIQQLCAWEGPEGGGRPGTESHRTRICCFGPGSWSASGSTTLGLCCVAGLSAALGLSPAWSARLPPWACACGS